MFCRGYKQRIEALERELAEERARREAAETRLAEAEAARGDAHASLTGMNRDLERCRKIYHTMQSFGDSFLEIQRSQVSIANAMREEKRHAVEAATVSGSCRQSMEKIAESLSVMASDSASMAGNVEGLSDRANQIGGIVQLIREIADQTDRKSVV